MQNQHAVLYLHLKDTCSIAHLKMKAAVSTAVNSVHFCSAYRFFFAWAILCFNIKKNQQVIISHKTENLIFDHKKSA